MPPLVPRKRLRSSSQEASSRQANRRKETLFDDLDATASPHRGDRSNTSLKAFTEEESESSLTSLSDEDFENVPIAKRRETEDADVDDDLDDKDEDEEDEDIEFEDVATPFLPVLDAPLPTGDLELTLNRDTRISLTSHSDKKGPTKIERQVRIATHCVHVLSLLWHNAVRNAWLCDPEVQAIMVSHLPPRMWDEVERWRRASGLLEKPRTEPPKPKGRKGRNSKGKERELLRDWGDAAERQEEGAVDLSYGDPLFRLMQHLVPWWRQRYKVTAPGLRKWGYMALERLDRLAKAHKDDEEDQVRFGELVRGLDGFRQCASSCRGSRDVGAQLFTALLRGLGLDARMVASLQPLGFGWNKLEDANPEKEGNAPKTDQGKATPSRNATMEVPKSAKGTPKKAESKHKTSKREAKQPETAAPSRSIRKSTRSKARVIEDSDDELEMEFKGSDDDSVIEMQVTPPKNPTASTTRFDRDLDYPHYWTEVLSPVTSRYLPVDPIVKGTIATNRELVETFESRGARADKARQVVCYVVGHSRDGTAKDVTVRYLKRQVLPGRTKGSRMPLEKVPVYDRHGKVKRYETMDWFKSAMSGYGRGSKEIPLTEVDYEEDATDLKPAKAEKKEVKEGEETLQYYKQSPEFVLRRHLKREEALRPDARVVRVFKNKGKGGRIEEEDVYRRSDVVLVKSAETWHKQGRAPIVGEVPLKMVPYRAATLNRKREILEAEAMTGQKVLQGLFSEEQTDWIIPPPIKDGVIPKNDYGNIDMFAEHMCPEGAVHVPYRGVVKVCRRLQIDFAEAVVGFEFGHRMAVPVIQGAVVAEEHYETVMAELEKDEAERKRKEDEKRRKAALGKWRKFLMGMRIVQRIRQDYGEIDESVSVFGHSAEERRHEEVLGAQDEDAGGGFLPEGYEEEHDGDEDGGGGNGQTSSFFPSLAEDDHGGEDEDDELVMEHHRTHDPKKTTCEQKKQGGGGYPEADHQVQSSRGRLKEDEDGSMMFTT
ncbi:DNA repair protein rhp42 [Escovopsis weberi]|uniref:DNA repair protein rhp42 n=1 Tax=Escovopsis weberi TaxID=150374 RepID=A0A0M8N9N7_ESCWE|nr:DNA repair protein rhp42 [Escovopsis weberi]